MLTFVTTNQGKLNEARAYLDDPVEGLDFDYPEIQAPDLGTVAADGARLAYRHADAPVIVEDAGLLVDALEDFPGPYSSYVEDTIGIEGVWHLAEAQADRGARFKSVVAYCDGREFDATPEPVETGRDADDVRRGQDLAAEARGTATTDDQVDAAAAPVKLFEGTVHGDIVAPRGEGGFGFDPIFEHDGRTFAEMDVDEKNAVSHRGRSLARFAEWYTGADR
jgi:XTP/dITP diphosphohydrolase